MKAILAMIVAIAFASACQASDREPTYKGLPYSHWQQLALDRDPQTASEAVIALAAAALGPTHADDPFSKDVLERLSSNDRSVQVEICFALARAAEASPYWEAWVTEVRRVLVKPSLAHVKERTTELADKNQRGAFDTHLLNRILAIDPAYVTDADLEELVGSLLPARRVATEPSMRELADIEVQAKAQLRGRSREEATGTD